ncbi:hypothetical protein, partial [Aeromonas veronii]|uniref:hypothetical protein n=1 Tax=Aeromonas veronii TaxID=654 RepID=UPI003D24C704
CFLLPASCFLLPASCFLLPASCFLLISLMGTALLYAIQSLLAAAWFDCENLAALARGGAICADCADMEGACLVDVMQRRERGL